MACTMLVIRNAACLCPMDPERRVILDNGAVAARNGRIIAVGTNDDIDEVLKTYASSEEEVESIDARNMLVLPGLVDAHGHAGHGLLKTLGYGKYNGWLYATRNIYSRGSTEAFWEAEASLCALERLKFGITTGVSLLGSDVFRTDDVRYGLAHCNGVSRVGTKSVVAVGANMPALCAPISDAIAQSVWVYTHIEESSTDANVEVVTETQVDADSQLRVCEKLIELCHDSDTYGKRVKIAICYPVIKPDMKLPDGVDMSVILAAAKKARALANKYEGVAFTQDGHSCGTVSWAHKHELLDGNCTYLSHSTDLNDADFEALKESGASVVHNPSAVASVYGRCPIIELLDAGVGVAIGSDGTAPDRSTDLFRHMQQAMHYHRRHFRDPQVLPPGKALEMVTIDAARVLGLNHEIGSLEVGKRADISLLNLSAAHLAPLRSMPLEHAIAFANGSDMDTVIIDGKILMRGRHVLTVNEDDIIERATIEADKAVTRCGLAPLREVCPGFWGSSRYQSEP